MPASKRQLVIDELKYRLGQITVDAGFQTDAGETVFVGQAPALGPDDPTSAIGLLIQEDQNPGYQGEHVVIRLPVRIHAIVRTDVVHPTERVEAIIADIKQAVELDHDLTVTDPDAGDPQGVLLGVKLLTYRGLERGITQAAYRAQGTEYGGGFVEYLLVFRELWGAP